ncbi:hypothetical protein T484DRAFT_1916921, partial [Baffinella frigidus]
MRSVVPPTRGAWVASALLAGVAAVAMCWAVVGTVGERAPGTLVELQQQLGGLPAISSTCLAQKTACIIAVRGGSLRLTGINFRKDEGYGSAMAVGFVNGQFVSGKVQLRRPESKEWPVKVSGVRSLARKGAKKGTVLKEEKAGKEEEGAKEEEEPAEEAAADAAEEVAEEGDAKEGGEETAAAEEPKAEKPAEEEAPADEEPAAAGDGGEESEQYKVALEAVEAHMEARQKKVEEEAKKIAEAVTRVITSPAVSKKIADLAMDAAAAKVGPGGDGGPGGAGEASQTGAVTGGVEGMGASGYADEPAGSQGPGCGLGCAGMTATSADLLTVPTTQPSSASTAYYNAWKAGGANVGGASGGGYALGANGMQQVSVSAAQHAPPQPLAVPDWGYPVQYGVQMPAGPSAEQAVAAIADQGAAEEEEGGDAEMPAEQA